MSLTQSRASLARNLIKTFGPEWVVFRAGYAVQQRTGAIRRRTPIATWDSKDLAGFVRDAGLADPDAYLEYRRQARTRFLFAPADRPSFLPHLTAWTGSGPSSVEAADDLLQGRLRCFSGTAYEVGFPPAWHTNSLTGQVAPADRHWNDTDELAYGDVKGIWEASRFGFAFDLVRAYWRTGDERYPEAFWALAEDW